MDDRMLNSLRQELDRRVEFLRKVEFHLFSPTVARFLKFLWKSPVFRGIIEELLIKTNTDVCRRKVASLFKAAVVGDNDEEAATLGFYALQNFAAEVSTQNVAALYGNLRREQNPLDCHRDLFLEPFYQYLVEQLGSQQTTLSLLRKYKHRSEWFRRERLHHLAADQTEGRVNLGL